MTNDMTIKVRGNDAVDEGMVEVHYSRGAGVSPLHLEFTRRDGFKCSVALTHSAARELLVLLAKNV